METLESKDCGIKWWGWIQSWLSSTRTYIQYKGLQGREIRCQKGLQQTPLSLLMFTLTVDGLNAIINEASEEELITGLLASNQKILSYLQYADDTIIFGDLKLEQTIMFKWFLWTLEIWLGLKVNFHKGKVIFLGQEDMTNDIAENIIVCFRDELSIEYLESHCMRRR